MESELVLRCRIPIFIGTPLPVPPLGQNLMSKFNPIGKINKINLVFIYPFHGGLYILKKRSVISSPDDFNHNFF
jgi:hypothetical protein